MDSLKEQPSDPGAAIYRRTLYFALLGIFRSIRLSKQVGLRNIGGCVEEGRQVDSAYVQGLISVILFHEIKLI